MHRITLLVLGLALLASGARAQVDCAVPGACIDCSEGCTVTKYGMGNFPGFRKDEVPTNNFRYDHDDFGPDFGGVSYFYQRTSLLGTTRPECGPERAFVATPGQMLLREPTACVPVAEGPNGTCDDASACSSDGDCAVGACSLLPPGQDGGCRVEILPANGNVTAMETASEIINPLISRINLQSGAVVDLSVAAAVCWGCSSDPADPTCLAENLKPRTSQGTRYVLPASRGGDGSMTYIAWDDDVDSGLRGHSDDSGVCCNSSTGTLCGAILSGQPEYPLLLSRTCADTNRITIHRKTNDWIFEGGQGTRFHSDPEHETPGQQHGVCRANRLIPCAVGFAGAEDPCPGFDSTFDDGVQLPGEPGFVADSCDLRERGHRIRCPALADGNPDPTCCGSNIYVLRGTPEQGCALMPRYDADGDPGPDCGLTNYRVNYRVDEDCDGVADFPDDLCPFLTEFDQGADADGDCADPDSPTCRGDECECSDQSGDGRVDITDILEINDTIFETQTVRRLCDGDADLECNVADILAANEELFVPASSACRHVRPLSCGDGVVDAGEQCDDGNLQDQDGCDEICRLEL